MRSRNLFCVFICAIAGGVARAEGSPPGPPEPLNSDWVVKQVLTRFPEVHAKRRAFLSALERVPAAGALDDPSVGVMVDNWPTRRLNGTGADEAEKMIELSQKLPFPGKRGARAELAQREAEIVYVQEMEHHLELQWRAQQAFQDYVLADQRLALLENQRRLLEAYVPAVRARSHRNVATPRDLAIDTARLDTEILKVTQERIAASLQLNSLMDRNWQAPLTKSALLEPTQLPANREELAAQALQKSAPMRMAQAELARATQALDVAKRDKAPDFTVFGRYSIAGSDAIDDSFRLGVSMNLPLWSARKQDRLLAAATHDLGRTQEQRRADANGVVREVTTLYEAARTKRDMLRYYRQDIIPRVEQLLRVTTATYQSGRADILQFLDAHQVKLTAELEALQLHIEYEKLLADLTRATGSLPPYITKMVSDKPLNTSRDIDRAE